MKSIGKEMCMKILFVVGRSEGVWFDPWDGVSNEEFKIVEEEYNKWEKESTDGKWNLKE